MPAPSPQRYLSGGRRQAVAKVTLDNALAAFARIRETDPRITPVLTLRHFSVVTGLPYLFLRRTVARRAHIGSWIHQTALTMLRHPAMVCPAPLSPRIEH